MFSDFLLPARCVFQEYLHNYGYINPLLHKPHTRVPEDVFKTALVNFQKFVGLKPTGTINFKIHACIYRSNDANLG
jgi:hypothetical protein